jgi:hypothetical protein
MIDDSFALLYLLDWMCQFAIVNCVKNFTESFFFFLQWQLGFTIVVYPCLVLAYMGEAAYLSKHREDLQSSFYKALPGEVAMLM